MQSSTGMKRALIVWGGWDGHQPEAVARLFERWLLADGFGVEVADSLDAFADLDRRDRLHLVVPVWTMGTITERQSQGIVRAVRDNGIGLAGCHGGMCDAFRSDTDWQFMTGGQWVAHPGDDAVRYRVNVHRDRSLIVAGIDDFDVVSEQYYLHTDPSNRVLATTRFPVADGPHVANGPFDMPVVWTRQHGKARVFYNALGHHPDVLDVEPVRTITRRGFAWAAKDA